MIVCLPKKYIRGILGLLRVACTCNCYSASGNPVVSNRQIRSFSADAKIEFYYNDIYEVPLPPQHRFPMEKYKLVREKLTALNTENTRGGQLEFCVSPLASREELITTHCPKVYTSYCKSLLSSTQCCKNSMWIDILLELWLVKK